MSEWQLSPPPRVYGAIAAIVEELGKIGIAKNSKNAQQNYMFRGIDAVYGALSPLLAKYRLCVLPRVMSHQTTERATKSGAPIFYTVLQVEFDFVSAEDGSKHTVATIGEAMDTADKSSNKAMSAAYKYACFQAFCIPLEGEDHDADATTHEIAPKEVPEDCFTALADAAKEGEKALRATWRDHISEETRHLIVTSYADRWNAIKASAAQTDKAPTP